MSALISHKYKFIFPHIPRTGGTSFTEAVDPFLTKEDREHSNRFEKHQALQPLQSALRRNNVFNRYVKIVVIRHPFERFVSLHQGYSPKCSLPDMVNELYEARGPVNVNDFGFYWPMKRWICDVNGNILANTLLRYENMPDNILKFLQARGIEIDELPWVNKGPKTKGMKEYYDEQRELCKGETMRKIRELYAWDYKALRYA